MNANAAMVEEKAFRELEAGAELVGVERFDFEAGGLIDDDVMGIQEDDDGSLWVSTKRGLTRFDPKTGSFARSAM